MLRRIVIENYRCFKELDLTIPPSGLVVLIGPNGSGKSTVLEALDLLARAVESSQGLQDGIAAREGLANMTRNGQKVPVKIQLTFEPLGFFKADGGRVEYEVVLAPLKGFPAVQFEEVRVYKQGAQSKPLVVLHRSTYEEEAWVLNVQTRTRDRADGTRDEVTVSARALMLSSVRQDEIYPTVGHVHEALLALRVYGHFSTTAGWLATPSERSDGPRAPGYPMTVAKLHPRGLNLPTALFSLRHGDPRAWHRLTHSFVERFPQVGSLDFGPDEGRIAMTWRPAAAWDPQGDLGPLPIHMFSDGMLAWLTVLAATELANFSPALVFDEPETHLHPEVVKSLVGLLEHHARTRCPVLVATHSDRFLDWLGQPADSVRVLTNTPDGAQLKTLSVEGLKAWSQDYRLGELRARGHLETSEPG